MLSKQVTSTWWTARYVGRSVAAQTATHLLTLTTAKYSRQNQQKNQRWKECR
jgi:hypothetical protein